ncbi:MAG: Fe-S cluster assembly ATPase SufC [Phycisphaerales bacterium]|jgi:Fe-S cluster assembly ATP-binding protein|nr:Fe-S cluster assembly ATPase SufC [Phycisphaerales bacterium]
MTTPLLEIKNVHASVDGTEILKGVNLTVMPGEVHSIMGPNGSGKSTLSSVIAGHEAYEVTEGSIMFQGVDLLELEADQRACAGVFLAFQYPVEIPGVSTKFFLKAAVNAVRKYRGQDELDAMDFLDLVEEKAKSVNLNIDLLDRNVNQGFSGGEKKRAEVFQMAMLDPLLGVLDETDSGLDIDALKIVAEGVNKLRAPERGFVVITHYQRLLDYIVPDYVHVLMDGKIVRSGDKSLALALEEKGYAAIQPSECSCNCT